MKAKLTSLSEISFRLNNIMTVVVITLVPRRVHLIRYVSKHLYATKPISATYILDDRDMYILGLDGRPRGWYIGTERRLSVFDLASFRGLCLLSGSCCPLSFLANYAIFKRVVRPICH